MSLKQLVHAVVSVLYSGLRNGATSGGNAEGEIIFYTDNWNLVILPGFFVAIRVANFSKATGLQKLFSHTFVQVLFKNNYIHKCISAILLVILLLIHSIKLLHTHSNNNSLSNHICSDNCFEKNDEPDSGQSFSDCSICNYQLTKDADDLVYPEFCNPVIEQTDLIARSISFDKFSNPSALENRGPPANML
jgi:hypothetical protein